jgi:predicted amidohydrolase
MPLRVATCQFPTSSDIQSNCDHIAELMNQAKSGKARVAHFPEACLAGYATSDVDSYEGVDWELLRGCTRTVMGLANELNLWVILGSIHQLTPPHKPHDSVYVTDPNGDIVERYDKRFCSGNPAANEGDLSHFSPGDHLSVFAIDEVCCGIVVCYDYRFPELLREYKRNGVQLMFHSFHAAHVSQATVSKITSQIGEEYAELNHATTYPEITMPATMIASAASSHVWISCPNSSAEYSCFGSFFVRADGVVTGRLDRHETGVLISVVDPDEPIYESTKYWRDNAMRGILHSGELVDDPKSSDRTSL